MGMRPDQLISAGQLCQTFSQRSVFLDSFTHMKSDCLVQLSIHKGGKHFIIDFGSFHLFRSPFYCLTVLQPSGSFNSSTNFALPLARRLMTVPSGISRDSATPL